MRELLFHNLFGLRHSCCRRLVHRRHGLYGLLNVDLPFNLDRLLGRFCLLGFRHDNGGLDCFGRRPNVDRHRGFERLNDRVVRRVRVASVAILADVLGDVGQDSPAGRTDLRASISVPLRRIVSAGVAIVPLVLLEESELATAGWTRKADHANQAEAECRE